MRKMSPEICCDSLKLWESLLKSFCLVTFTNCEAVGKIVNSMKVSLNYSMGGKISPINIHWHLLNACRDQTLDVSTVKSCTLFVMIVIYMALSSKKWRHFVHCWQKCIADSVDYVKQNSILYLNTCSIKCHYLASYTCYSFHGNK